MKTTKAEFRCLLLSILLTLSLHLAALADGVPRLWVLHDEDPDYINPPFDDTLTVLDASGTVLSVTTGFNTCQSGGGWRALAVDSNGNASYVCAAGSMSKVDLQGNRLFSISGIGAVDVAPNGYVFALGSSGTIEGTTVLRISPAGVVEKVVPVGDVDLVVDPNSWRVYLAGADLKCVDYDLNLLWTREDLIGWSAMSVDVASDGSIWVAERRYSPATGQNRLLHLSNNGTLLGQIPLSFSPFCARVDRSDDSIYVAGAQLQKYNPAGTLLFSVSLASCGWSLAVDPSGGVWVGGWSDVWKYSAGGTLLFSSAPFGTASDTWVAVPVAQPSGPARLWIAAGCTNLFTGSVLALTAFCNFPISSWVWDFGDGTTLTNQTCVTHTWVAPGSYTVRATGYNGTYPGGLTTTLTVAVVVRPQVYYVSGRSTHPQWPYATWATAASNIQDAVNVATTNEVVIITNGIYPGGVIVTNPLRLQSVNGPQFTVIDGGGTVRCVSLTDGASLTGFTLTNGAADWYDDGGGVSGGTLYDCMLAGNGTTYGSGGGAAACILYGCILTGNEAWESTHGGGGAYSSTLYNCTLSGNVTTGNVYGVGGDGGGANNCYLFNCALIGNSSLTGGGASISELRNCTLIGNVSMGTFSSGGGANSCTLYNCTLNGNSACQPPYESGYGLGGGACSSTLFDCTLTNNTGSGGGGAVDSSTLFNCVLTRNLVTNGYGGGAFRSTLLNCVLTGNSASAQHYRGGGAHDCTLYNCTLTGNSAWEDGGAGWCELYNSIVYFNTAAQGGPNYESSSTLNFCCTIPLPACGLGNITNAPLFVDYAIGNLHLQSSSPCINAGNNGYVTNATDLDGKPRIVGGTVDIGAYEYQGTGSRISYAWLQQYGLPTDGSADFLDPDHDGMNNWQEWACATCPTNALSVLRLVSAIPNGADVTVAWQSVAGINYFLQCSTNLTASPSFWCVATNLGGQTDLTSFVHTNALAAGSCFYRVGVRNP